MGREETMRRVVRMGGMGGGDIPIIGGPRLDLTANIHDKFNRPLVEGDVCLLPLGGEQPFVVRAITPAEGPGVPAGFLDITLSCVVRFRAPRGEPNNEFVRVLTAEEANRSRPQPQPPPAQPIADQLDLPKDDAPKDEA